MGADSVAVIFEGLKNTLAGLYAVAANAEPIITRQLEILIAMRLLGNIMLFVCFLLIFFVLFQTHKEAQGVAKYTEIKIKKKWLIVMFAVFAVAVGVFNIYPGVALANLNKDLGANTSLEQVKNKLFGEPLTENTKE